MIYEISEIQLATSKKHHIHEEIIFSFLKSKVKYCFKNKMPFSWLDLGKTCILINNKFEIFSSQFPSSPQFQDENLF